MRVLFLIAAFIPFILTVHAQRSFSQYICELSHKHHQKTFYLKVGESKKIKIGNWNLYSSLRRADNRITVNLRRVIAIMDATYRKEASRSYPLNTDNLPVSLEHHFGGKTDVFEMVCYPRS